MTLQTIGPPCVWPGNIGYGGTAPALGNGDALTASGHYSADYFVASEDMVVTHIGLKCASAASTPQVSLAIETVSAGLRTGTDFSTNSNTGTVTPSTTFTAYALTGAATISRGSVYAVVIRWVGGSVTPNLAGNYYGSFAMPYHGTNVSGSDVKSAFTQTRDISIHSSATAFYKLPGYRPVASWANGSFNNTSSAKKAAKLTFPFKARIIGLRYWQGTGTGDFNYGLLASDGSTVLSSSDTAYTATNSAAISNGILDLPFDSPVNVEAGTVLYAYVEPTSATNVLFWTATLPTSGATAAQYRGAWPGGVNFIASSQASGTWTDSTTDVPLIDILYDQLDVGVGGRIIGG